MTTKIINMALVRRIETDSINNDIFRIKLFFDEIGDHHIIEYNDKNKANKMEIALSKFKGNLILSGGDGIVNLNLENKLIFDYLK